ncbi:uncharacterized protein AruCF_2461 [Achromobacter ruhlandii]|nr:uncharacterized protein AruCF_2461 [Achromobacter ruhlandii]
MRAGAARVGLPGQHYAWHGTPILARQRRRRQGGARRVRAIALGQPGALNRAGLSSSMGHCAGGTPPPGPLPVGVAYGYGASVVG